MNGAEMFRSGVDDVDVEVVPDAVVVVVGVLLHAGVALPQAVRAQLRVAPGQALSPAVPLDRIGRILHARRFYSH